MTNFFQIIAESYKKDLKNNLTYKFNFFGEILIGVMSLFFIFFFSELVQNSDNSYLQRYENNYFLFLLCGVGTVLFISKTFSAIPASISSAQSLGYFENLINTKTNIYIVLIANAAFPFTRAAIRVLLIFMLAFFLSGEFLSFLKFFELIILLIFSSIPFLGVAFIISSLIIIYKRANFINSIYLMGCTIFSGVLYPVSVMPSGIQFLSFAFPTTFSLEIIRGRIIENISYFELIPEITILIILSIIFLLFGMLLIRISIKKAKHEGTISHY